MSLRLFYTFLAFSIFTLQPQYSNVEAQETPALPAITPFDLINGVNSLRTSNGLPALIIDDILMGTAQYTADYMAVNDLHGHIGDVSGRVMAAGYGSGTIAWATENFAIGPISLDTLFNVYWADDLHMAPMYKPNYLHIGAGVAEYDGRVWYIVHAAYTGSGVYVPQATATFDEMTTPGPAQATAAVSEIIYPVITVTPNPDGTVVHVVQSGQSLWSIAIAYGTKIDSILSLNGISSGRDSTIYIGQKLLISVAASPTTSPTSPTVTATVQISTQPPEITQTQRPTELTPTASPTTEEMGSKDDLLLPAMITIFGFGLFLVIFSLVSSKRSEKQQ